MIDPYVVNEGDVTVYQRDTFEFVASFTDQYNQPIDFTDCTGEFQAFEFPNSLSPYISLELQFEDGNMMCRMEVDETELLTSPLVGNLYVDVTFPEGHPNFPEGGKYPFIRGPIVISLGGTR